MTISTFIIRPIIISALLIGSILSPLSVHAQQTASAEGAVVASSLAVQKAPQDVVKDTVNAIVTNIQANRGLYEQDTPALYKMVEDTLVPALHISRMSNLILGRDVSRSSSDAQKNAFAEEFKTFLMRSYATALLEYTGNEKVVYDEVKPNDRGDKVLVKATLIASNGQDYPMSLYMSNRKDTQWRAYNVEVAGINFISTYRSTFGSIIAKKGIDGLITDLREKNAQ